MDFSNVMNKASFDTTTENGAKAYSSLDSDVLTLFAQIGSLRTRSVAEIEQKFEAAYKENRELAIKMLFYAMNIRGGLGERRTATICLTWLARYDSDAVRKNIALIPHFGRWDEVFALVNTPCEKDMYKLISDTLIADMYNACNKKPISLCAKWMPSENASSQATRHLARRVISCLDVSPANYRKMLSLLREYLKITERAMSTGNWENIDYKSVPSRAMHLYASAFGKHDYERFDKYIKSLEKGTTKVNASVLYPYDLVKAVDRKQGNAAITEAQWKALPNYVNGENNFVVMADVSGSMYDGPIYSSVGLAIYFAQHNKGRYHNLYMTFTTQPHYIKLNEGDSLEKAVRQVWNTDIGYGTNLQAAFDRIFADAVQNRVRNSEMPKALIVISDGEIDSFMSPRFSWDFMDVQRAKFAAYGYELPKIVMWNIESRQDAFVTKSDKVIFVSGNAASTFKSLCANLEGISSYDMMLRVLNDKMYDCIKF